MDGNVGMAGHCVRDTRCDQVLPELFNAWGGGRGCHNCVPVLGGDGTNIVSPGYLFDQFSGEIS